jgi:transposase-like protein
MTKVIGSEGATEAPMLKLLGEAVRQDLRAFVINAGMEALKMVLEAERTEICGRRYEHQGERKVYRSGHAPGELVLGGRRVRVERPRARGLDGKEAHLPSWKRFANEDPLGERAVEQMLLGVSTRGYDSSLEGLGPGVQSRGTSKSAVSRRFISMTTAKMSTWLGADLSAIDLSVLMIDGVHIDDHVLLVALGIDTDGKKHVLGIREGATENSSSCKELLADLRERGLPVERTTLVVIDGSKALAKAIREVFGSRALIQRCQVHKARNVLDELPDHMRTSVRAALREAYRSTDIARAKKLLQNLARRLREHHPGAAASLEEGLDETLTVLKLGLPGNLTRVFSNTNAIENLIGSVRRLGRRVRRWRDGKMILRWTVASAHDASTRFRRVAGAKAAMSKLVLQLRALDNTNVVAQQVNAA